MGMNEDKWQKNAKKKSPGNEPGRPWVIEGARTPDPQNHNLML